MFLGTGMSLFCSKSEPLNSSLVVLGNTLSVFVHHAQIVLGKGNPLISKRFPFTQSGCVVLVPVSSLTLPVISLCRGWSGFLGSDCG